MENNNLNELEQLKAQYETLKQQFDQQEIVNERLMRATIHSKLGFIEKNRLLIAIILPTAYILGFFSINKWWGDDLSIWLFWILFLPILVFFDMFLTKKFSRKMLENSDLQTISKNLKSYKRIYKLFNILNYATVFFISVCFLLFFLNIEFSDVMVFILAMFINFAVILFFENRFISKRCDNVINQIENPDEPLKNRNKTGLDKKQKLLCLTMVLVFISFSVWAYLISARYAKLPPNPTYTYTRAEGNNRADGNLEIWEVYNSTTIADKARYIATNTLEDNDSLIYRWSVDSTETILYTLRKTTEAGPAISSAVLGGKPLVKKVARGPYREGTTTSIIVNMQPEAAILMKRMTENAVLQPQPVEAAVVLDGQVYQSWYIKGVIDTGAFFILAKPSMTEKEVEELCNRLIKN